MQALHQIIADATAAALKITALEHVKTVERGLLSSLQEFPLAVSHPFANIAAGPGIYYFDIRFPFSTEPEFTQFLRAWGSKGASNLQKGTSRSYPKRAKQHIAKVEASEFVPFYLGKNMNVQDRVIQHLTGAADAGTYGLKLLTRSKLLDGCTIRVGGVVFEVDPKAYFCIEFLEAAIRERLHPIIGKQ